MWRTDSDAGKDWRREEKGTTEDEIVGWHHWLNEHAFEQAPGVRNGQGGLACCDSWGRKESDTTEWLNWTELKVTEDSDCSHEIKRHLLLGGKAMTILNSILKSRDISLPNNFHLFQAMIFLVVMYGCDSWTIKKAEHLRIYVFELWCQRRLLRVPWTTKRSNQSILKEISPEIFLGSTDAEANAPILCLPDA